MSFKKAFHGFPLAFCLVAALLAGNYLSRYSHHSPGPWLIGMGGEEHLPFLRGHLAYGEWVWRGHPFRVEITSATERLSLLAAKDPGRQVSATVIPAAFQDTVALTALAQALDLSITEVFLVEQDTVEQLAITAPSSVTEAAQPKRLVVSEEDVATAMQIQGVKVERHVVFAMEINASVQTLVTLAQCSDIHLVDPHWIEHPIAYLISEGNLPGFDSTPNQLLIPPRETLLQFNRQKGAQLC